MKSKWKTYFFESLGNHDRSRNISNDDDKNCIWNVAIINVGAIVDVLAIDVLADEDIIVLGASVTSILNQDTFLFFESLFDAGCLHFDTTK